MFVKYPVYVHPGDDSHAHGVALPDFPGCFSAADEWADIPGKVQEAVEVYCEGEDMELPKPGPLEGLRGLPEYQGGEWMMVTVNVDVSGIGHAAM